MGKTILELKRENKKLKESLTKLTKVILEAVTALDVEMPKPSSFERGKRIAEIRNYLEFNNDSAMHFALDYGFKKISKLKKEVERKAKMANNNQ